MISAELLNPALVESVIYRHLFPLIRGVSGRSIMGHVEAWDRLSREDPERQRENAWRHIQAVLAHAHEHVPFYRQRFRAIGADPGDIRTWEDFEKFPPLTREELRSRLPELIADNIPKPQRNRMHTSGSTGLPVNFWIDKAREPLNYANVHLNQRWIGFAVGEPQMLLWSNPVGPRGWRTWKSRARLGLLNRTFFACPHLNHETMALFHRLLVRRRPKMLVVFPSRLAAFIHHCDEHGLKLPHVPLIISSAEGLTEAHRRLFEQKFGADVFDRYGSVEMGDITHECPAHEGMHINTHRVWLESLPGDDFWEGDGTGKLHVTDLHNLATPLIRYETGDIGRLWDSRTTHGCPCGRTLPRLAELVGRSLDVVKSASGTVYFRPAFELPAERVPGIRNFQVVHRRPRTLIYRCHVNGEFPLDGAEQIAQVLREATQGEFDVSVVTNQPLERTRGGKLRLVVEE